MSADAANACSPAEHLPSDEVLGVFVGAIFDNGGVRFAGSRWTLSAGFKEYRGRSGEDGDGCQCKADEDRGAHSDLA